MSETLSLDTVRRFFEAFDTRSPEAMGALLTDDVRWIITGRHPLTGDKQGIPEVLAYFAAMGRFKFKITPIFMQGDAERVVDVHHVYCKHNGKTLDQKSIAVWTMRGGKIASMQSFPENQYKWDEFLLETVALKPLPDRLA